MRKIDVLKKEMRQEEGEKDTAYLDSEGYWTIAVGHLLNEQTDAELEILGLEDDLEDWEGFTITPEQREQLLDHDINETLSRLRISFDDELLESLAPKRFLAMFNMCYQIGSVSGFPAFVQAVKDEDWDRASKEMMFRNGLKCEVHSKWYRQTPKRCKKMAEWMRTGGVSETKDPVTEIAASLRVNELSQFTNEEVAAEVLRRLNS